MSEANMRLRQIRKDAGYETGSDAARAFGWKVPTYLGHENGDRPISKKAAIKYAAAFRVSPLLFLYDSKPKGSVNEAPPSVDVDRLAHMVGFLLHWRGLPELEADNLARAIVEYACTPLNPGEPAPTREEARTEARTLMRLHGT